MAKDQLEKPMTADDRVAQLEQTIIEQGRQLKELSESLGEATLLSTQPARVVENTANVMFIGDRAVVKHGQAREHNGVLLLPVTLRDKAGKLEEDLVPYIQALNDNPRFAAEILDQVAHPDEKHQGAIPVKYQTQPADPVGLKEHGRKFEAKTIILKQTIVTYTAKLRFLDGPWAGEVIEVDTRCLNP